MLTLVFTHPSTLFIHSPCTFIGSQPYSDKHTARDNAITAFLTWGEGYHNFHHEFANDYRNGVRWYQFDPGKWANTMMSYLHLAWGLKRVPDTTIKQRRMQMQKGELVSRFEKWKWSEERKAAFLAKADATLAAGQQILDPGDEVLVGDQLPDWGRRGCFHPGQSRARHSARSGVEHEIAGHGALL